MDTNYNRDEYPTFRPRLMNAEDSRTIIREINERGRVNETESIRQHLSDEYNILGHLLQITPVQHEQPIYFLRESSTVSTSTLYLFYFYRLGAYDEQDMPSL